MTPEQAEKLVGDFEEAVLGVERSGWTHDRTNEKYFRLDRTALRAQLVAALTATMTAQPGKANDNLS
jgi:hypothetical protein